MPQLSFQKLVTTLGGRRASSAVFLHGDEDFLREEALQRVVGLLLDPATRDFNLDQLYGSDATPETLASTIATPPMMAEYRLVIIREVQGLSPKVREVVVGFLESPTPGVALLLSGRIPSGSKAKFYTTLKKGALSVEFPAVEAVDLPGWLLERARSFHDVEIDMDAARALSSAIGSELGVLTTELEKAVSFIGARRTISLEDIKSVGGYIPRVDRWAWFDAVGERRFSDALADLPELLDSGESGVGLIIGIGGQLLKIGLLVAGGREALERHLKPNQRWLANRLQSQARDWNLEQIDFALESLLRTDRLLKSASLTDRQAMEDLLLQLTAGIANRQSSVAMARAG